MSHLYSSGFEHNARDTHHFEPMLVHGDEGPVDDLTPTERRELAHQKILNKEVERKFEPLAEYLARALKGATQ